MKKNIIILITGILTLQSCILGGFEFSKGIIEASEKYPSTTGSAWTKFSTSLASPAVYHNAAVFRDDIWVFGGLSEATGTNIYNTGLASLKGGFGTISVPVSNLYDAGMVVYNDALWVIGGVRGGLSASADIWRSEDGTNWQIISVTAIFGARAGFSLAVHNNALWLFGGYTFPAKTILQDIWVTTDGSNWSLVTATAPFPGRIGGGVAVFKDHLVVLGGAETWTRDIGDTWTSRDGTNWTKIRDTDNYNNAYTITGIHNYAFAVHQDRIWIYGGESHNSLNEYGNAHNIYASSDMTNWTRMSPIYDPTPAGARFGHTMVSYKGQLWSIGGFFYDKTADTVTESADVYISD